MLRLILLIPILFIFQACQVAENVTSANQTLGVNFPNSALTTLVPNDGWKKLGDNLDVTFLFPTAMHVSGSPYIEAQIGNNSRKFYYQSGSGSTVLVFRYTVDSTDMDLDGINFNSTSINLNGGEIYYYVNSAYTAPLPLHITFPDSQIYVDGIIPTLDQIIPPSNGHYATAQHVSYSLIFSEEVFVSGTPSFDIFLDSGTVPSNYKTGSGTNTLEFSRQVQITDLDSDGFSTDTTLLLNPSSDIYIVDQAGNELSATITATNSTGVLINIPKPIIAGISVPSNGTYTSNQSLIFSVTFSEPVNVEGNPSLPIRLSTGYAQAQYLSGSGGLTLDFEYTVGINQADLDGIEVISPIQLNAGSIKNTAGNQDALTTFTANPSLTSGVWVDSTTGPYIQTVLKPQNGTYTENDNLDFILNFSGAVTVAGSPRLPIIVGSITTYADYLSTSGSSVTFRYTPQAGEEDLDGISLSGPVDPNGGSIVDASAPTKTAIYQYIAPTTIGILVDATTPSIVNVYNQTTGLLTAGQVVKFIVEFSEPVTVTPPLNLPITINTTTTSASYVSGSGTNKLQFEYTVLVSDSDANGINIVSPLTGGSVSDSNGHSGALTFANDITNDLIVDGVIPSISSIIPPANMTHNIGDTLTFTVNFNEPIFVTGTPKLLFADTTTPTGLQAIMSNPGAGGVTSLTFSYIVKAGDLDTNGITLMSLQLYGGSIKDSLGNNANLTLPAVVTTSILLDGVIPTVTNVAHSAPIQSIYKAGEEIAFKLTWSEAVTVTGSPTLNYVIGDSPVIATLDSAYPTSNVTSLYFKYTVLTDELDLNGINLLSAIFLDAGDFIRDQNGNNASLQINAPDLTAVNVDAVIPKIAAFLPPGDATYTLNENLYFTVLWTEPISVDTILGTPRIELAIGPSTVYATYDPTLSALLSPDGMMSIFKWTVGAGYLDSDGITIVSPAIDLNLGFIEDAALNSANVNFTTPTTTGVLVDGIKTTVDPLNAITPPANDTYILGETLTFNINFTGTVNLNTAGGTPYVNILVGSTYRQAYCTNSNGFSGTSLTFSYTAVAGDLDTNGIDILGPIYANGATIEDPTPDSALLTFANKNYPNVKVEATPPTIVSATTTNATASARPAQFRPGEIMSFKLVFSEPITKTGTPRIVLDIGGQTKYANWYSGSSTTHYFRYTVDASNAVLDLDGIQVTSTIDMNGGNLTDASGNAVSGSIPYNETDYVYYSNIMGRYQVSGSNYNASTCDGVDTCLTQLKDISGNNYHLNTSSPGPKVKVGFGNNLTSYLQFNNLSHLKTPTAPSALAIRQVIFVMKTVTNGSTTSTTSNHTLLNRKPSFSGALTPAIKFSSNSTTKTLTYSPYQKSKFNLAAQAASYAGSETGSGLWVNDTHYILTFEFSSWIYFYSNSLIGGSDFNGRIAEIIFLSGPTTPLGNTYLDNIVTQLNAIHGVY
jgi:large repetitive protein